MADIKMPIRVFISGNSGNKEIVTHQTRILMILNSLGIETEVVDITAPAMDEARDFMRQHGKKKEGKRFVLPPQIFNGEKYCGDYEDFDIANEDDELEEFLGIPRKSPKFDPNAGTNAGGEAGKSDQPTVNGNSTDKSEVLKEEVQTTSSISSADDRLQQATDDSENNNNSDKAGVKKAVFEDIDAVVNEECTELNGSGNDQLDLAATLSQEQIIDELANKAQEGQVECYSDHDENRKGNVTADKPCEEDHNNNAASYAGVNLDEEKNLKRKKLHIEVDEAKANAGFQNIKNAGRFWKASQIMGTRKEHIRKHQPI